MGVTAGAPPVIQGPSHERLGLNGTINFTKTSVSVLCSETAYHLLSLSPPEALDLQPSGCAGHSLKAGLWSCPLSGTYTILEASR